MNVHVGIDVSKNSFDLVVHEDASHHVFDMTVDGIKHCAALLKKMQPSLVVMEATGGYEFELFVKLAESGIPVAVVNPRQIRDFARACGKLAKTDKIDAEVIARFAAVMKPSVTEPPSDEARKIKALAVRRRQLVDMITAETNRKSLVREKAVRKSLDAVIKTLRRELDKCDDEIGTLVEQSPEYRRKAELMRSIPGIGDKTVSAIIAHLPEIGSVNRRRIAALVGLAPRNRDSGMMRGKRTTGGGRKTVRTALYMPTVVAIQHNPVLRSYYHKLVANGKERMVALVACMRKLLTILNSIVGNNQSWNPKTT